MDNKSQKLLAFIAIFLLLMMYKESVLDRYLGVQKATSTQENKNGTAKITTPPPLPTVNNGTSSVATSPSSTTSDNGASSSVPHNNAVQYPKYAELLSQGIIEVDTESFHAIVSQLGGRLISLRLKKYAETIADNSPRLELVPRFENSDYPMPLGVEVGKFSDLHTQYNISKLSDNFRQIASAPGIKEVSITGADSARFELHGTLPDGSELVKSYDFMGSGYLIGMDVNFTKPDIQYDISWNRFIPEHDPALTNTYAVPEFVWYDGQRASRELINHAPSVDVALPNLHWLSLGDHYFMASLLASDNRSGDIRSSDMTQPLPIGRNGRYYRVGNLFGLRLAGPLNSTSVNGAKPQGDNSIAIYVGPKNYADLEKFGRELRLNVNLGKTGFVSAPLLSVLHLIYSFFGNYGVAVVLLTIIVKLLTYPLSHSSFKQMKAMQEISPEIKRIRETVEDQAKQQQELMALYKKRGVNPFGGCFPMFLQLPIFIGLYSALSLDVELRHAKFAFWIQDLSAKEGLPIFGVGIPVMAILMVIAMMVQQWITPSTADPVQKRIMLAMPVIMGFMFMNLPAGLTLYFLTNSIISISQTQGLYRGTKATAGLKMTLGASFVMFFLAFVMAKVG